MSQLSCANTEQVGGSESSPCPNPALSVCKGCFLVQYCSKACQLAHWSLHKRDCKSPMMKSTWKPAWDLEKRKPDFFGNSGPSDVYMSQKKYGTQKYLWGNVPAIDVVNHLQNESRKIPEDLHLLFAASGDIRNVAKSIAGLPPSYSGKCEVVINDRDFDIVARNAILLLTALHFEAGEAAAMMLHIWYSALVPEKMLRSLQDRILPIIEDVCSKIRTKPATSLQSKTWTFGSRSLRLVLQKAAWDLLPSYLRVPEGMTAAQAKAVMMATTLAPQRKDYAERAFYARPPSWRVGCVKFRQDGILLPFGHPRNEFDTPNPTFFQSRDFWPMMDSAEPLNGWSINEVIQKAPLAKNDIYGGLFIHVVDVLQTFCRRLKNLPVCFQLFQLDALELPGTIQKRNYFDRIEISNIADRAYIGPQDTLATFGPLLKRKSQNPHAALLALFLNATHEVTTPSDYISFIKRESEKLQKYLRLTPSMLGDRRGYDPDFNTFNDARLIVRDLDMLFARLEKECRLKEISAAAGLRIREKNTIIEKWPMRLKNNATQKEFDLLLASGHMGSERYVEWEVDE